MQRWMMLLAAGASCVHESDRADAQPGEIDIRDLPKPAHERDKKRMTTAGLVYCRRRSLNVVLQR
jgi:hypothetical protein